MTDPRATPVELTGKRWKGMQLGGCLSIVAGVFLFFLGWPTIAVLLVPIGVIVYLWARIGAWWNHG